jgi:hypothetical protein
MERRRYWCCPGEVEAHLLWVWAERWLHNLGDDLLLFRLHEYTGCLDVDNKIGGISTTATTMFGGDV